MYSVIFSKSLLKAPKYVPECAKSTEVLETRLAALLPSKPNFIINTTSATNAVGMMIAKGY